MKRIVSAALAAFFSSALFAATLNPIQLLNPAGSTSGQAIVSTGASTAPSWSSTFGPTTFSGLVTAGNLQLNTGLSIGPTAASLAKDINVSQAVTGTTSANCTTTTLIMYPCANLFYISSDGADASSAPGPVLDGWQFSHNFGGSTMKGGRQVLDVIGHFTAPSNPANPLPGYVGIVGELITNSGDNGTAPTIANGRGSFFAMNPVVVANSGAQNLLGIAGEEVNVQCNGCSTAIRYGVSVVQNGANQAAILANDAAFHVGNVGAAGGAWHQALNISNANGLAPLDTTACVICTDTTNNTIGTGIDLHNYTITGNFLSGPNGFAVTGAGGMVVGNGAGIAGGLNVSSGGAAVAGGLAVTGAVSGPGFSSYLASPPAIGGTAAAAGTFTTLKGNALAKVFATNTSAQSIASGSNVAVTGWTAGIDANSNFVASTGTFTAPATGYYVVTAQLVWGAIAGAGSAGQIKATVYVNGAATTLQGVMPMSNTTQTTNTAQVSGLVSVTAGQTITLDAFQNSGSAVALSTTAGAVWLNIYQLP